MEKLDWMPLYIDELLSSPAYLDMSDYQFGWYLKLLLRSTRSARLGYLPLDGQLWRLAGARSRTFFEQENARVMACFRIRQFDGLDWIYNQKLLSVLEDQSNKYRRKSSLISPVLSDFDLGRSTSKPTSKAKEQCKRCSGKGYFELNAHPGKSAYCDCEAGLMTKRSGA